MKGYDANKADPRQIMIDKALVELRNAGYEALVVCWPIGKETDTCFSCTYHPGGSEDDFSRIVMWGRHALNSFIEALVEAGQEDE